MRKRLYKHSSVLGYNTRDNPTSVPFNSAQIQENLTPNDPNPIPRDGSEWWGNSQGAYNGIGTVLHVMPYSDSDDNYLICISSIGVTTYIYYKRKDGIYPNFLIYSSIDLEFNSIDFSYARIKNMIYISNGTDSVYIIERLENGNFNFRNANIERPDSSITPNIEALPVFGGSISQDKYIGYAVTYVRRQDSSSTGSGGLDLSGDPQRQLFNVTNNAFHPGVLESVEVISDPNNPSIAGERVSALTTSVNRRVMLTLNNLTGLDEQVTHARIYRTLEFDTEVEALAASFRWLGDFPVTGPNDERIGSTLTYTDEYTNNTMAGNFNFSLNIGTDPMPAGRTMTFHNGRLWIGGVPSGSSEFRGRYFYSVPPQDPDYPEKWYSMFLTGNSSLTIGDTTVSGWKDTDHEDDEFAEIVDVSRNDIVFINSQSVWLLPDGDPEGFEPELLDRSNGTLFNHSIVHIDDALFYLSNNGPCMIEGRLVKMIVEHTAGEVWPKLYDNSRGYFYTISNPKEVKGYYARENWILADNSQTICMYMPRNQRGFGPWKFIAATTVPIMFGLGVVFNEDEIVVYPYSSPNSRFYSVLVPGLKNDTNVDFVLHQKGKAQYMSDRDREMFGEASELIMFCEFTDPGQLILILTSDYFRFTRNWYYEDAASDDILNPGSDETFRLNINQVIREGFLGQLFEIEWIKMYSTPYRFIHKGWTLDTIIRHGKHGEWVSADDSNFGNGDIIETGVTPFDIIESGAETYSIIEGA